MAKHIWISNENADKIKLSPYTDIFLNGNRIALIRTEFNAFMSIKCSNETVVDALYQLLIDGYTIDEPNPLLEDETVRAFLEGCIRKGILE